MKRTFAALAAVALAGTASAQTSLIGGFDFSDASFDGFTYNASFEYTQQYASYYSDLGGDRPEYADPGTFSPRVSLYFDGTHGSDAWEGNTDPDSNSVLSVSNGGSWETVNAEINTDARTSGADFGFWDGSNPAGGGLPGLGLGFRAGRTETTFVFDINNTGFNVSDLVVSLAGYNEFGTGTVAWSYSINGGAAVSTGLTTVFDGTAGVKTVDLSGFSDLDNQWSIQLIGEVSGSGLISMDNIQFTGVASAIPEPSTYAAIVGALALGGVLLRRRFAKA